MPVSAATCGEGFLPVAWKRVTGVEVCGFDVMRLPRRPSARAAKPCSCLGSSCVAGWVQEWKSGGSFKTETLGGRVRRAFFRAEASVLAAGSGALGDDAGGLSAKARKLGSEHCAAVKCKAGAGTFDARSRVGFRVPHVFAVSGVVVRVHRLKRACAGQCGAACQAAMIEMILGCRQDRAPGVNRRRQSKGRLNSSGLATSAFPNS